MNLLFLKVANLKFKMNQFCYFFNQTYLLLDLVYPEFCDIKGENQVVGILGNYQQIIINNW